MPVRPLFKSCKNAPPMSRYLSIFVIRIAVVVMIRIVAVPSSCSANLMGILGIERPLAILDRVFSSRPVVLGASSPFVLVASSSGAAILKGRCCPSRRRVTSRCGCGQLMRRLCLESSIIHGRLYKGTVVATITLHGTSISIGCAINVTRIARRHCAAPVGPRLGRQLNTSIACETSLFPSLRRLCWRSVVRHWRACLAHLVRDISADRLPIAILRVRTRRHGVACLLSRLYTDRHWAPRLSRRMFCRHGSDRTRPSRMISPRAFRARWLSLCEGTFPVSRGMLNRSILSRERRRRGLGLCHNSWSDVVCSIHKTTRLVAVIGRDRIRPRRSCGVLLD